MYWILDSRGQQDLHSSGVVASILLVSPGLTDYPGVSLSEVSLMVSPNKSGLRCAMSREYIFTNFKKIIKYMAHLHPIIVHFMLYKFIHQIYFDQFILTKMKRSNFTKFNKKT